MPTLDQPQTAPARRLTDGDAAFTGVDERGDPSILAPGLCARARNKRFRNGPAKDRPGLALMRWGPGDGTEPFTNPHGAGTFKDPSGREWIFIAAGGRVWRTHPMIRALEVPLPAGVTIDGEVQFHQAFDTLLLARGAGAAPLALADFDTGFEVITQESSGAGHGTGTLVIPNFLHGLVFQNRLAVIEGRDQIKVSDILNYTRHSFYGAFRLNQGEDDNLQALAAFGEDSVIAFKANRIYRLFNLTADTAGDLTAAQAELITDNHGLRAPRAVVQVGADLWYLSTEGLTSLRLTTDNKTQSLDLPLSVKLEHTLRRLNWQQAGGAVMSHWDNKLYCAVPLDNSSLNNAVLVFDFYTREWAGYDDGPVLDQGVSRFIRARYLGRDRLFALTGNGYLYLYEDGLEDELWVAQDLTLTSGGLPLALTSGGTLQLTTPALQRVSVGGYVRTRGYLGGATRKRFARVRAHLATWHPVFDVSARVDGVSEIALLASETRDRLTYTTFGTPDWDPSNVNDDFAAPHREDYSLDSDTPFDPGVNGVDPDLHQDGEVPLRVIERGRHVQFEISSTQGRCDLVALETDATPVDRALFNRT